MLLRSSFLGLVLAATVFGLAASACSDDADPAGTGGGASVSSSSSSGAVGSSSSSGSGGAGGQNAQAICDAAQAFVDMCQPMGSGGAGVGGAGGGNATGGAGGGVLSFPDCTEVEQCEANCVLLAQTCQDLFFNDNVTDCIFCCHSPCN